MFRNYWKTSLRNLWRNKAYAIINMLGLAVGLAACMLIFLVVRFETSFDTFHPQKDRIYRVCTEFHTEDGVHYSKGVAFPVAPALRLDYPQVKQVASVLRKAGQVSVEEANGRYKKLKEDHFYFVDPSFFDIFQFEFVSGSANSSLKNPNDAVLTQETAEKYFGNWKDAIGKIFTYDNNNTNFTVTGILKNPPPNTDFPFSVVVPYSGIQNTNSAANLNDWVSTFGDATTFIVLPSNFSVGSFNKELASFAKKHKPAEYAKDSYVLQPLKEMHFDDRFGNYRGHTFSHGLVDALSLVGIFLLVIGCANFINLATAQAVNRSKEVGVRKVLGSSRMQLAIQFLNETAMITFMALLLAVVIAVAALPALNKLLETEMSLNVMANPLLIFYVLIIGLLTTFLSGLYPAIVLSGFSPITVLKNKFTTKITGRISLRRALVVFQFGIAHVLIIGMLIVVSQMDFFRNASLGFEKEAILNVGLPNDSVSMAKQSFVRNTLLANPNITNVSFSFNSPSSEGNWTSDFKFNGSTKETSFNPNLKWADSNYFSLYNLQFVAGRPYSASDTAREFIVNETLLRKLGINNPKDALGKELNFWDGSIVGKIVGVIKDFNAYSLKQPVAPVVLSTWKAVYVTANIKIKPGSEKTVLPFIEKTWTSNFPNIVYNYSFLDETINNFYKQESQLSILYKIFAGIAIFISCLGLYGLVSFMALKRTKEIGIRKVLGARELNIVYLLSREFTLLIIIAFVIAGPIAWFIMHRWLENYTYRIHLGIPLFLLAVVSSVIIAWLTVGYRAIHAALANPVTSLRTE